jgi:hypothetical protein
MVSVCSLPRQHPNRIVYELLTHPVQAAERGAARPHLRRSHAKSATSELYDGSSADRRAPSRMPAIPAGCGLSGARYSLEVCCIMRATSDDALAAALLRRADLENPSSHAAGRVDGGT